MSGWPLASEVTCCTIWPAVSGAVRVVGDVHWGAPSAEAGAVSASAAMTLAAARGEARGMRHSAQTLSERPPTGRHASSACMQAADHSGDGT